MRDDERVPLVGESGVRAYLAVREKEREAALLLCSATGLQLPGPNGEMGLPAVAGPRIRRGQWPLRTRRK